MQEVRCGNSGGHAVWCLELGLDRLQGVLKSPPLMVWKNDDWDETFRKEAIPLPLALMEALKHSLLLHSEDELFLCGLLLMCWGGLRCLFCSALT